MDLSIIPECNIDTNLVETIVPPVTRYNHQKGCGTVARKMQLSFTNSFAVGIIDRDKRELDYLKEFDLIVKKGNLELYKHPTLHHYFIRIYPAMERFILINAANAGISLIDFDLPTEFERFKKITKTVNSKNDPRFKKLFQEFSKKNLDDVVRLKSWITYLKEKNYQAKVDELEKI